MRPVPFLPTPTSGLELGEEGHHYLYCAAMVSSHWEPALLLCGLCFSSLWWDRVFCAI